VIRSRKMQAGSMKHERWKNRSKLRHSELTRYFGAHLTAPDIGLFGILDALDYDGESAIPIELKTGHAPSSKIYDHHKAQLLTECLLAEVALTARVRSGIIIYENEKSEDSVKYGDNERVWVSHALSTMREIVSSEIIPEPTDIEAKCVDCEYMGVCRKI